LISDKRYLFSTPCACVRCCLSARWTASHATLHCMLHSAAVMAPRWHLPLSQYTVADLYTWELLTTALLLTTATLIVDYCFVGLHDADKGGDPSPRADARERGGDSWTEGWAQ